jgi:cytochrome c biogenesis protein CcdA
VREQVAFAFAAGMVAAINPCGFALLPAYLTYFLGLEGDGSADSDTDAEGGGSRAATVAGNPALRALRVSAAMTAGFVVVFGVMGLVWGRVSGLLGNRLSWVTVVLGIGLVIMGIAMIRGFTPVIGIPKLSLSGDGRETWSVFLYGLSYAVASLSCTIGVFVATVTTTFDDQGFIDGVATFLAYGLGMGALVAILTVAVSFAREGIVTAMRRLLPHIGRISGGLMILAGAFVAYYGWWETQILAGNDVSDGPAGALLDWNAGVSNRISEIGAGRIGLVIAGLLVIAIGAGAAIRRARRTEGGEPELASSPQAR